MAAEAPVRLQDQVIDENDGGFGRVRQANRLGNDNRGVIRGQRIYDTSKVSETTTEAAGARQQAQGIYDNDGGGGR